MGEAEDFDALTLTQKLTVLAALLIALLGSFAAFASVLLYGLIFADLAAAAVDPMNLTDLLNGIPWLFLLVFLTSLVSLGLGIWNVRIAWRSQEFFEDGWQRYVINSFLALMPIAVTIAFRTFGDG